MSKRYRHDRRRYRHQGYRNRIKWHKYLLCFCLGLLAGLIISFVYQRHILQAIKPTESIKPTTLAHQEKKEKKAIPQIKEKKKEEPSLQFDFYTELPKAKPTAPPSPAFREINAGYQLWLKRWLDDRAVQQYKARLSLLGFEVKVATKKNHQNQIIIGPYPNLGAAKQDQQHLQNIHIATIVKKFGR